MNTNRAFLKSIHFLSRPQVFLLLGVLLINDHLLRRLWPSYWTGKLGDFAWLFIAPAIACALLAGLIPARWKRQEKLVGLLGYGLTALFFALLKTLPAFRDAVLHFWQSGLGFPAAVRIDPTDLLALALLALSAGLWLRQKPVPVQIPPRGWLVLPLFALLTLADAAAPDYGIACLALQNNQVVASAGYASFASPDGGLTWVDTNSGSGYRGSSSCSGYDFADPISIDLPGLQLRSYAGSRIESSGDGGSTWQVEYRLAGASEARDAYTLKTAGGNPMLQPGPLDALYDPTTGSVIFAMGHQGLLVRRPDATYTWASAGHYGPVNLGSPDAFLSVLGGEMALAASLVFLLCAAWLGAARKTHWVFKVWAVLAWLAWGVGMIFFPPAMASGYSIEMAWIAISGILVLTVPLGAFSLLASHWGRRLGGLLLVALVGGLVFLLPYVLWYFNVIPHYPLAQAAASIIVLSFAIAGMFRVVRRAKAAASGTG